MATLQNFVYSCVIAFGESMNSTTKNHLDDPSFLATNFPLLLLSGSIAKTYNKTRLSHRQTHFMHLQNFWLAAFQTRHLISGFPSSMWVELYNNPKYLKFALVFTFWKYCQSTTTHTFHRITSLNFLHHNSPTHTHNHLSHSYFDKKDLCFQPSFTRLPKAVWFHQPRSPF